VRPSRPPLFTAGTPTVRRRCSPPPPPPQRPHPTAFSGPRRATDPGGAAGSENAENGGSLPAAHLTRSGSVDSDGAGASGAAAAAAIAAGAVTPRTPPPPLSVSGGDGGGGGPPPPPSSARTAGDGGRRGGRGTAARQLLSARLALAHAHTFLAQREAALSAQQDTSASLTAQLIALRASDGGHAARAASLASALDAERS